MAARKVKARGGMLDRAPRFSSGIGINKARRSYRLLGCIPVGSGRIGVDLACSLRSIDQDRYLVRVYLCKPR